MSTSLNPVAPAADMAPITPASPAAPTKIIPQASDQADVRLVIEEDGHSGSYIYKTLDRRTGEVLGQYPREQILRLREDENYSAGTVIDARA